MAEQSSTLASKPSEAWFENTWWWKVKLRLQWTGWLQFIPNLAASVLMLLLAAIGVLIPVWPWVFVGLPSFLAAMLFLNLMFDIATVRFGLHPEEALPIPREDLDDLDLIRARVSCRSFQKRDLTAAHKTQILDLVQAVSRPENCVGTHPIRLEYLAAPLTVWPVVGGTEFLVAIAERTYHEDAVLDIGRSLQQVVLQATRMGLATCWIGPGADPSSIAQHLGPRFDPMRDHVICVCAIGYASRYKPLSLRLMQRSQRWRKPIADLFYADTNCTDPIDINAEPYAAFDRCLEGCQWSPSSYNSQTTRAVVNVEGAKLTRVDFCAATKSRYYAVVALGIWIANWEFGCRALGIDGHVVKVSVADEHRPELPRYVLSWIRDM